MQRENTRLGGKNGSRLCQDRYYRDDSSPAPHFLERDQRRSKAPRLRRREEAGRAVAAVSPSLSVLQTFRLNYQFFI